MRLKLFTIPYSSGAGFDDSEMTEFLADKHVVSYREHVCEHDGAPLWSILVGWTEPPGVRQVARADWRGKLSVEQQQRYDLLRTWRNERSKTDGKPAYVIFTNRVLAEIAKRQPKSRADLQKIEGVGPSRVRDYADAVLAVLSDQTSHKGE